MNLKSIFSPPPTSNRFNISSLFGRGKRRIEPVVSSSSYKALGGASARSRLFQEDTFTGYHRRINRASVSTGYEAYERLSSNILNSYPAEEVRNIFVNNNPNVSRAINDFRKFMNPGWVLRPAANPLFSRLFDNMGVYNEDLNTLLNGLSDSMFKDGASFTELILNEKGDPRRILGIPAFTAVFERGESPDGDFSELGQDDIQEERNFRSFHGDPTIRYYPLLPEIGNPYGRLIMDSAIYHLMMVKGFFQSYKEAISSIIWPNLLISIDREQIAKMPPQEQARIISNIVDQVNTEINKLEPGGILTFGSEVQLGGYISGMNRTNLGAVTDCINIMNSEIMRALESESVLFGMTEGLAETHVTQQMRNYGYFIQNGQKILNRLFTHYFNLILFLNGSAEKAVFQLKFAIAEERLETAKVYQMEREALKTGAEDLEALVVGIEAAKLAGYFDEQQALEYFEDQMELRRTAELFPSGF